MNRKAKAAEFVQEGYQISITGRNVILTDAIKNYVQDKISRIEKFTDRIINVNVIMDIQRADQKCEITLKVNNIKIYCSAVSKDMYASVDKAVDKLENQLLKYKTKLRDHRARNVATIDMNVNVIERHADDEIEDINDGIEEETDKEFLQAYKPHQVVNQETMPLKTLTQEEAVMKMDLSGDVFLIYRSEEDRKIKVIYRRKDANYGVIETE